MICPKCNSFVSDASRFCSRCGSDLGVRRANSVSQSYNGTGSGSQLPDDRAHSTHTHQNGYYYASNQDSFSANHSLSQSKFASTGKKSFLVRHPRFISTLIAILVLLLIIAVKIYENL